MKLKIERLGGSSNMQHVIEACAHCSTDARCRRREFSEQAWSVLALWNQVQKPVVDQAICEDCYDELREVLIDRADEIEAALSAPPAPKSRPGLWRQPRKRLRRLLKAKCEKRADRRARSSVQP